MTDVERKTALQTDEDQNCCLLFLKSYRGMLPRD